MRLEHSTPADLLREAALSLPGTTEAPHFDRQAFRVKRIYCTLAPSGESANLRLTPEDQEHGCGLLPGALSPVPNRWGARGWTEVKLADIDPADLAIVLRLAWSSGGGRDPMTSAGRRSRRKERQP